VPVLGDLPYVGFLFKNNEKTDDRRELLIFITPRILKETLTQR
jgi:type IV pilus assembly protein PilQ